eukprot:439005_1
MPTHKYKIVRKNFLSYSADEFPTFDYSLTNERPELDDELSINAAVRCFLKVDDSLWVADGNGFVYIRSFSDGSLIDSFEIPRKKSDSSVRSLCNAMCLHEDLTSMEENRWRCCPRSSIFGRCDKDASQS